MLVSTPLLRPPDLTKPFYLLTDTSEKGFGALLEQDGPDGKKYPITYASRQTNPYEVKYNPTDTLPIRKMLHSIRGPRLRI